MTIQKFPGIAVLIGSLCLWFVATTCLLRAAPVYDLRARITDKSSTLSSEEIQTLERKLADFEKATSNQVVLLMIGSLEGDAPEDYALRLAEQNRLGKRGKDNGVLVLISKDDRIIRIEVGYGLEGVLTDALSGQIMRQEMYPRFRAGDFYGGIDAGLTAIMAATRGEYQGEPESEKKKGLPLAAIIIIMILVFLLRRMGGGGGRFTGGSRGWRSGGPWIGGMGGGFGGGFGGGGFGGGGFSGGGGSFGGGGATGRW